MFEQSRIVIERSNVEFLDSSIIGAFVGSIRAAREEGGDVKLAKVNPDVGTLFELTCLDHVFRIHASVDEALREYRSSLERGAASFPLRAPRSSRPVPPS